MKESSVKKWRVVYQIDARDLASVVWGSDEEQAQKALQRYFAGNAVIISVSKYVGHEPEVILE